MKVATAKENKPQYKPKPNPQTQPTNGGVWEIILVTVENGTANTGLQAVRVQPD